MKKIKKIEKKVGKKKKPSKFDLLIASLGTVEIDSRRILRSYVRGYYDTQGVRIKLGQKLVANFYAKIGIQAGKKLTDASDPIAKKLLKALKLEYKRISDAVAKNRSLVNQLIKTHKIEGVKIISDSTEFVLMETYMHLLQREAVIKGQLRGYLDDNFEIWNEWLKKITGLGELMGGVIISEFDIHKATYVTSMWKYSGLDVVEIVDKEGNIVMEGRRNKKEHHVDIDYINKDGKPDVKKGLSYNPFLKSKLLGVLGPSILMQHKKMIKQNGPGAGTPYGYIYYNYRNRLEQERNIIIIRAMKGGRVSREDAEKEVKKGKYSDDRLNRKSIRYMIKLLIRDLYPVWKKIEGLPAVAPYEERMLGMKHGSGNVNGIRAAA